MIVHYSQIEKWPFKRFPLWELACPCCKRLLLDDVVLESINRLAFARELAGKPFNLNSAYRCLIHNALVDGAPLSQHKVIAFDISLRNHNRFALLDQLKNAGLTTFGFYRTFIHTDIRPGRRWYGKGARELWNG